MKRILFLFIAVLILPSAHAALDIQSWKLPNGARVLFVENHTIPILDISVEFDAGARREPREKAGLASLTNQMLSHGVSASTGPNGTAEPALTEAQISDSLADTAAQHGANASLDRAGVTLRTLSSPHERDASVLLVARMLAQPSFPEDILARDKARVIAAIRESLTKPEAIGAKAFMRDLYGTHPYGLEATEASVSAVTRQDLVEFHRTHYLANQAIIAMIGDISRAEADAIARQLTARLSDKADGAPANLPPMPAVPPLQVREERIAHPASQAHILIGAPSLARGDQDYFPLIVGNYILGGGGFVSRLTHEVREKRGLSYSVYSYFNPLAQEGPFQIGLQTKKEQTDQALQVVRDTVAAFLRDGPTEQELKAAKDNLIGGFPLRIDNNRKILDNMAAIGFYNLPLDYLNTWTAKVNKVTVPDIRAAFKRKLAVDHLSTVIVGLAAQPATAQRSDTP